MRHAFLGATCAASIFFFSSLSFAQPPPIFVVEVSGAGIDGDRIRREVGKELGVTAIAPDDPIAASAVGRLSVDAAATEKRITVTFQKLGATITRTVDLPTDTRRAEATAVLLAGNLARDEAGELASVLRKSAPPPPQKAESDAWDNGASGPKRDEDDYLRLRLLLHDSADRVHAARNVGGWVLTACGVALAGGGAYVASSPNPSSSATGFATYAAITGGLTLGTGIALLLGLGTSDDETAWHELVQREREPGNAGQLLMEAERSWEKRADSARSMRKTSGIIFLVVGGLAATAGTVVLLAQGPHSDSSYVGAGILYAASALELMLGAEALVSETPVERSWRTWQTLRQPMAGTTPRVGLAPAPGGGMISLGFAF
jgi:hypothetical protein